MNQKTEINQDVSTEDRPIIIIGNCVGEYSNRDITRHFEAKILLSARTDGGIIIHDVNGSARPLVYMVTDDYNLSINAKAEIIFTAQTKDNQKIEITFWNAIITSGEKVI